MNGTVININDADQQLNFERRRYRIDVLGGWGVKPGEFSISLRHIQSGEIIESERTAWRVQYFAFGKKAKRMFVVDIPEAGFYRIEFKNAETLRVKESNLFFGGLLQEPVKANKISFYIH